MPRIFCFALVHLFNMFTFNQKVYCLVAPCQPNAKREPRCFCSPPLALLSKFWPLFFMLYFIFDLVVCLFRQVELAESCHISTTLFWTYFFAVEFLKLTIQSIASKYQFIYDHSHNNIIELKSIGIYDVNEFSIWRPVWIVFINRHKILWT